MTPGNMVMLWSGPAMYSDVYLFARDTNETRDGKEMNIMLSSL